MKWMWLLVVFQLVAAQLAVPTLPRMTVTVALQHQ
jgi:hypothetical protein